jgi:ribosomal subunit interface protein
MKTFDVNNIQLKIQAPGVQLTPELVNYILQQIDKTGKLFDGIKKCEMILKQEKNDRKNNFTVEAKLFIPDNILFASLQDSDFKITVKNAFDNLRDQLMKSKDRWDKKVQIHTKKNQSVEFLV